MTDDQTKRPAAATARAPQQHMETEFRKPSGRLRPQPDLSGEPLETGIVSRGKSVHVPVPGAEPQRVGWDKTDGTEVTAIPQKILMPGDLYEGPASEVARLKRLGYLVDENRVVLPGFNGNGAA